MSNKIADFFAEIGIKADFEELVKLDKKLDDLRRGLHNFEVDAKKASKNASQSLSKAINQGTKQVGKQRAEIEKTTESFWQAAEVGKKAAEINNKYLKKVANQAKLTSKLQAQALGLGEEYKKKVGFSRLGQVEAAARKRSASVGENKGDFYALKEDIRARLANRNPAVAGKFGNLVFAETRMAKERAEIAAKAAKDEIERQKYLKQLQQSHLKEQEAHERAKRRAIREQRQEENRRHQEAMRNIRKEQAELRNKILKSRLAQQLQGGGVSQGSVNSVGRPRGMFGSASFGGAFGAASSSIAGFLPGFGAAYTLMNANRINQELQSQKMAMQAVMAGATPGSTPEQAEALGAEQQGWLKNLANTVGFDYRATQPAFTRMMASGTSSGFSVESVQDIFQGVSEYGRVMGLDADSMKGGMRAIEQMMNKGQIMSEELKGQLAERMPGVISAMAEAGGFEDQAALFKAMEDGKVKSDILPKFAEILSNRARAGGALEKAMKTSAAEQQRFNNALTDFVAVMGENGLEAGFFRIFESFTNFLKEGEDAAKGFGKAFERFSWLIRGMVNGVSVLGDGFSKLADNLGLSREALGLLTAGLVMAMLPFGKIVLLGSALLMVLDDLSRWAEGRDSLFKDIFEGLDEQTQKDILAFVDTLKEFGNNLVSIGKIAAEGWGNIFSWFSEAGGSNFVLNRIKEILNAINGLLGAIIKLKEGDISGAMDSAWGGIKSSIRVSPLGTVAGMDLDRVPFSSVEPTTLLQDKVNGIKSSSPKPSNFILENVNFTIEGNIDQLGEKEAKDFSHLLLKELKKAQTQYPETE